jgi:mRNA interferase MazF
VVQDDVFNRSRIAAVIVCALTTNLHHASELGNVLLDTGEGNLPQLASSRRSRPSTRAA